jgi:AmiR/NasT family two-component response regulator
MATDQPLKGLRVLIAEDEGLVAEVIRIGLEDAGCAITGVVVDGAAAIERAIADRPDLIVMDVGLKGRIDAIEAAELIHRRVSAPVVYLTAHSDTDTLHRANASSAYGFVPKPFRIDNLVAAIDVAMARFRMNDQLEQVKLTYATILESVSDGIVTTDTSGRVRFMNRVAERLTGWLIGEAQGRPAASIMQFTGLAEESNAEHLLERALS